MFGGSGGSESYLAEVAGAERSAGKAGAVVVPSWLAGQVQNNQVSCHFWRLGCPKTAAMAWSRFASWKYKKLTSWSHFSASRLRFSWQAHGFWHVAKSSTNQPCVYFPTAFASTGPLKNCLDSFIFLGGAAFGSFDIVIFEVRELISWEGFVFLYFWSSGVLSQLLMVSSPGTHSTPDDSALSNLSNLLFDLSGLSDHSICSVWSFESSSSFGSFWPMYLVFGNYLIYVICPSVCLAYLIRRSTLLPVDLIYRSILSIWTMWSAYLCVSAFLSGLSSIWPSIFILLSYWSSKSAWCPPKIRVEELKTKQVRETMRDFHFWHVSHRLCTSALFHFVIFPSEVPKALRLPD